ncbi:MAG: hypothetical protein IJ605_04180 [Prevotella sp.]|nr:hypothetical protein [Prevotella sp.]
MEPWIFNKKELRFIAKLMMDKLCSLPDNSELSLMDLFTQALQSEWVEGKTHEGYFISGYKVTDIRLDDGSFLHDHIKWDFENGIWHPRLKQGFTLNELFARIIRNNGFFEDHAIKGGRRMGYPYDLSSIWRKKENLIYSFANVEEKVIDKGNYQKYYIREIIETRHYQYRNRNNKFSRYDRIKPLQLWRIPKGCNTGVTEVEDDQIYFTTLKGKCSIESEYWQYERVVKKKTSWNNYKTIEELRIYKSAVARCNREEKDLDAPQKAWFQITNVGKSDLLLFVVDTSRFKHIDFEE